MNFGGTSSKCSIYEDEACICDREFKYTPEEENLSSCGRDQVALKKEKILAWLSELNLRMEDFTAIAMRGGGVFNGAMGGTYLVESDLYKHLLSQYTPDKPPMHAMRVMISVVDALLES